MHYNLVRFLSLTINGDLTLRGEWMNNSGWCVSQLSEKLIHNVHILFNGFISQIKNPGQIVEARWTDHTIEVPH